MSVFRRTTARPTALAAAVTVAVGAVALALAPAGSAAPAAGATAAVGTAAVGTPKVPGAGTCCGTTFLVPGGKLYSDNPSASTLDSVGLASAPGGVAATNSPFYLQLGTDGNLVEYRIGVDHRSTAIWSTGTRSTTPTTVTFQSDGNVVLRTAAGTALWSTGTAGKPARYFDVYGNGQVVTQDAAGRVLSTHGPAATPLPGVEIEGALSPSFVYGTSTVYELDLQADGNLVQYRRTDHGNVAVWSTRTAGRGPARLVAQSDGNLVLRQISSNAAIWASGSLGSTAYYQLDLQDDSNLVLYRTDGLHRVQAVWAAGFHR